MKKIIAITLILLFIAGLSFGCKNDQNAVESHQLSKLTVIKEPSNSDLQFYYNLFGERFDSLQAVLDDLVDNYNATHDNEVLFKLCRTLTKKYIKDCDDKTIEYYKEFFNKIWQDKSFYKKTAEYHRSYADEILHILYWDGKVNESIEFYDKYAEHLKDKDELVQFSYWYSLHYFNDDDPDHDAMVSMLNRAKTIENNYYDKVVDNNQFIILAMISEYSYKLGDEKTGNEYHQKATDVINKIMDNIED